MGVAASTLAEVVDLVTAVAFPEALAAPPPLHQVGNRQEERAGHVCA